MSFWANANFGEAQDEAGGDEVYFLKSESTKERMWETCFLFLYFQKYNKTIYFHFGEFHIMKFDLCERSC